MKCRKFQDPSMPSTSAHNLLKFEILKLAILGQDNIQDSQIHTSLSSFPKWLQIVCYFLLLLRRRRSFTFSDWEGADQRMEAISNYVTYIHIHLMGSFSLCPVTEEK